MSKLTLNLIAEEYNELREAIAEKDIIATADALCDLLYVIYGTGDEFGMDLDGCFDRVHRSNMSKFVNGKPILREDGKILKGPNYFPPDFQGVLF